MKQNNHNLVGKVLGRVCKQRPVTKVTGYTLGSLLRRPEETDESRRDFPSVARDFSHRAVYTHSELFANTPWSQTGLIVPAIALIMAMITYMWLAFGLEAATCRRTHTRH